MFLFIMFVNYKNVMIVVICCVRLNLFGWVGSSENFMTNDFVETCSQQATL